MSQNASSDDSGHDVFGISAKDAFKEIMCSSAAGMIAETFKYPLDLTKVRLQAQLLHSIDAKSVVAFNGPLDCLSQTWKQEGVRGLYRGVSVPAIGSVAPAATLFLSYKSFQNLIHHYNRGFSDYDGTVNFPLTVPQLGLAGAFAGFTASFILTPMELVKCKMQVQLMHIHSHSIRSLLRPPTNGVPILSQFKHPSPGHALQLGAVKPQLHNFTTTGTAQTAPFLPVTHPHAVNNNYRPPGVFSIVRSIVRDHGLKGLWLGQTGTLVRETGGCAVWFAVKELIADTLQQRRKRKYYGSYSHGTKAKPDPPPIPSVLLPPPPLPNILPWESALAGAAAGGTTTSLFYPVDTIKSAIQTEEELRSNLSRSRNVTIPSTATATSMGFWRTALKMYKAHGFRGFYAGCGLTVARSIPTSGIIFVVYDGLRLWLG